MIPQLMAASAKLNIGLKNMKCSPPTNGIQVGPDGVDYREIEHVYHFTIKPSGISSSFGHKAGNLRMGAFIKDYPI